MRTLLKEYKEISLKLLYELKKDNLNEVFKLSEERQQILYKLSGMTIDKTIDLEKDFNIYSLDKEIEEEIKKQRSDIKVEMDKTKRQKIANSVYGKKFEDIYFLNKKI